MTARRLAVALVAALLITTGVASAQSATQVTVAVGTGTRQLVVSDLGGAPLGELSLTPTQPSSFRVRVTDANYVTDRAFTVSAVMNNLYRETSPGNYAYTVKIPSQHVIVSLPLSGVATAGLAVDALPTYLLDLAAANCTTLLGGAADPLALLVCPVAGAASVTDLPVAGELVENLDLSGLLPTDLPLGIDDGAGGPFNLPSFATGIGTGANADPAYVPNQVGTAHTLLQGQSAASLAQALINAITAQLPAASTVTQAVPAAAVIAALQNATAPATQLLGNTLAGLSAADQVEAINALFDATLRPLGLADLLSLDGLYTSFPALTVAPPAGTVAGEYAGTMTVTLVES